ncbi:MAG: hypothetical protein Q3992_04770 [Bacteroides sp.]|nr:hypothetical protein [Bacteroides sp.]
MLFTLIIILIFVDVIITCFTFAFGELGDSGFIENLNTSFIRQDVK